MITVKLFGMTKLLAGNESTLTGALSKGHSVKNLIELVNKRYPKIGELIHKKKILVSVNQEIAHEETRVQEGDEVALLPPFAGGSQTASTIDDSELVRVQREDFSIDRELMCNFSRARRISSILR
jgi:molybdopterin synthase catalytic subunit